MKRDSAGRLRDSRGRFVPIQISQRQDGRFIDQTGRLLAKAVVVRLKRQRPARARLRASKPTKRAGRSEEEIKQFRAQAMFTRYLDELSYRTPTPFERGVAINRDGTVSGMATFATRTYNVEDIILDAYRDAYYPRGTAYWIQLGVRIQSTQTQFDRIKDPELKAYFLPGVMRIIRFYGRRPNKIQYSFEAMLRLCKKLAEEGWSIYAFDILLHWSPADIQPSEEQL